MGATIQGPGGYVHGSRRPRFVRQSLAIETVRL